MKFSTTIESLKSAMIVLKQITQKDTAHRLQVSIHSTSKSTSLQLTSGNTSISCKLNATYELGGVAVVSFLQIDSFVLKNIKRCKKEGQKLKDTPVTFKVTGESLVIESQHTKTTQDQDSPSDVIDDHIFNQVKQVSKGLIMLSPHCVEMWDLASLFCGGEQMYMYPQIALDAENIVFTGTNGHMATVTKLDFEVESVSRSLKHFDDALDSSFTSKDSKRKSFNIICDFKLTKVFKEDVELKVFNRIRGSDKWYVSLKDARSEVMLPMKVIRDHNHIAEAGINQFTKRKATDQQVKRHQLPYIPTAEHVVVKIEDMIQAIAMAKEYSDGTIAVHIPSNVNFSPAEDSVQLSAVPVEKDCVFHVTISTKESVILEDKTWVFNLDSLDRVMHFVEDEMGWCEIIIPLTTAKDNNFTPILFSAHTGRPRHKQFITSDDFAVLMPYTVQARDEFIELMNKIESEEEDDG